MAALAQQARLRAVAMDVTDQDMVDAAVNRVLTETGRLDVVIHNAGHTVLGPAEAFTVQQLRDIYGVIVLSTQRVNRAALPHLRARHDGLLIWVGSSSSRGGTPPYLAPYFGGQGGHRCRPATRRTVRRALDQIPVRQAAMSNPGADPADVARQITRVVDLPKGKRPFRVHIDPEHDGAEEAFTLAEDDVAIEIREPG